MAGAGCNNGVTALDVLLDMMMMNRPKSLYDAPDKPVGTRVVN